MSISLVESTLIEFEHNTTCYQSLRYLDDYKINVLLTHDPNIYSANEHLPTTGNIFHDKMVV